jgi:hypothetical protein
MHTKMLLLNKYKIVFYKCFVCRLDYMSTFNKNGILFNFVYINEIPDVVQINTSYSLHFSNHQTLHKSTHPKTPKSTNQPINMEPTNSNIEGISQKSTAPVIPLARAIRTTCRMSTGNKVPSSKSSINNNNNNNNNNNGNQTKRTHPCPEPLDESRVKLAKRNFKDKFVN